MKTFHLWAGLNLLKVSYTMCRFSVWVMGGRLIYQQEIRIFKEPANESR